MRASEASEELAWLPGLGVFGSHSMLYWAVGLRSAGWFLEKEETVPWLWGLLIQQQRRRAAPQGRKRGQAQRQAVEAVAVRPSRPVAAKVSSSSGKGSGAKRGGRLWRPQPRRVADAQPQQGEQGRPTLSRAPIAERVHSDSQVQTESAHRVLGRQGTWWGTAAGELGLGSVGRLQRGGGEPLCEAELCGGSLSCASFQRIPSSSSCPSAGPDTASQAPTKGACWGPWLSSCHRGHSEPSRKVCSALLWEGVLPEVPQNSRTLLRVPFCNLPCVILRRGKGRWVH